MTDIVQEGQEAETVETEVTDAPVAEGTEAETQGEAQEVDTESEEPKPIDPKEHEAAQKKIQHQRKALADANRGREESTRKLKELQDKLTAQEAPQPPKEDDFETLEAYNAANTEFIRADAKTTAKREALQELQYEQNQIIAKERGDAFNKARDTYKLANPSYDDSYTTLDAHIGSQNVPREIFQVIDEVSEETGMTPALIDYFGKGNGENLSEFDDIARMSPYKAAVAVDKLMSKLSNVTPIKTTKVKQTPRPVNVNKPSGKATKGLGSHSSGDDVLKTLGLK